uniref:Uncharacterized protein n=1 Tax=Rhizophora mucronata TaxID=61149 RepID=A0A2P2JSD6_RHIMU
MRIESGKVVGRSIYPTAARWNGKAVSNANSGEIAESLRKLDEKLERN